MKNIISAHELSTVSAIVAHLEPTRKNWEKRRMLKVKWTDSPAFTVCIK